MKQSSFYGGHFSGFLCKSCFRRLPRSVFYLPQEGRYLTLCRDCTRHQQRRSSTAKAA